MKKICKNCTYCRLYSDDQGIWCSNSKSINFRYYEEDVTAAADIGKKVTLYGERFILETDTCEHFTQSGKKAPLRLRTVNKVLRMMNDR